MNDNREFGWDDEILEEGSEYTPLEEGNYNFKVVKVERARSQGNGKLPPCNMAKVTFEVSRANDSPREITENFLLHSSLEWKLSQLFLSVGMKRRGEPLKMNWTGLHGKTGKCYVIVEKYSKRDGTEGITNRIKKLYAYDEDVPGTDQQPKMTAPTGWTPGNF